MKFYNTVTSLVCGELRKQLQTAFNSTIQSSFSNSLSHLQQRGAPLDTLVFLPPSRSSSGGFKLYFIEYRPATQGTEKHSKAPLQVNLVVSRCSGSVSASWGISNHFIIFKTNFYQPETHQKKLKIQTYIIKTCKIE